MARQDDSHRGALSRGRQRRPVRAASGRAAQGEAWQSVVVENKVGAGGNLAAAEAARADPDGYTLFIGTNGTQTINQSLYRTLPYDPAAN